MPVDTNEHAIVFNNIESLVYEATDASCSGEHDLRHITVTVMIHLSPRRIELLGLLLQDASVHIHLSPRRIELLGLLLQDASVNWPTATPVVNYSLLQCTGVSGISIVLLHEIS